MGDKGQIHCPLIWWELLIELLSEGPRKLLDNGVACYQLWESIGYLIESGCTPRPGPRFTWHRWVPTMGANEVIALKVGTVMIELSGQCLYGGVQRKNTRGLSDGLI